MKSFAVAVLVLNFTCAVYATVTISENGFKITSPAGTVTFNRITDTEITCEVALKNNHATDAVTLTKVELYLSTSNNLESHKSDAIPFTTGKPTTVPANANGNDGNGLETGMTADVKVLDGAKCDDYDYLCIKVSWGTDTTDTTSQCVTPIDTNCAGSIPIEKL
ncbi:uncharacterized protein [Ptychodera flava]|uniref:uncharacterized protein n=1 Tax=Ptychodera flava TaxID=63121 RepID=UPI00396A8EA3